MYNPCLTPLGRADVDGDSTMNSSPELEAADDDDLFPGEGPSTPRNAASFAAGPASELSPPNSQGRLPEESLSALAGGAPPSIINANGKRAHPSSVANAATPAAGSAGDKKSGPTQTDPKTGYQWSSPEDAPGYEWKSNRAREEEARALDVVVDKNTMIRTRYGDPLKPEVPMKLKR
ncbi:hypothetical protein BU23DRAFT_466380 [Bimuria novae-zelandiae CBS 107.79]|uniref:Uncharacterized protein n=1 Tax=Bimuria novae-zelandiae CBS 107.79 TaxID=1447943 RepID=A0A6A5V6C4_9PLEO|nr:hypothetical protein BU23DRAFT_466380 [Bimuria novae-zelandiae CBS 107.79]